MLKGQDMLLEYKNGSRQIQVSVWQEKFRLTGPWADGESPPGSGNDRKVRSLLQGTSAHFMCFSPALPAYGTFAQTTVSGYVLSVFAIKIRQNVSKIYSAGFFRKLSG